MFSSERTRRALRRPSPQSSFSSAEDKLLSNYTTILVSLLLSTQAPCNGYWGISAVIKVAAMGWVLIMLLAHVAEKWTVIIHDRSQGREYMALSYILSSFQRGSELQDHEGLFCHVAHSFFNLCSPFKN